MLQNVTTVPLVFQRLPTVDGSFARHDCDKSHAATTAASILPIASRSAALSSKQVSVEVECHSDAGMPHDGLHSLWRPSKVCNEQAGRGVAKDVEAVFRLAVRDDIAGNLKRCEKAHPDVRETFDVANRIGNTRSRSPLGQPDFQSRNVLITIGASGISRLPAFDFGGPLRRQASARCRT
jgi:hypothetical protein